MRWPDLGRFGWKMGLLVRNPNRKAEVGGIYLESLRGPTNSDLLRLSEAGFEAVQAVDGSPFRFESAQTRFNRNDLESWFPGFDWDSEMREEQQLPRLAVQIQPEFLEWWHRQWPGSEDLEAIDSRTGKHGWQMLPNEFEKLTEERTISFDESGQLQSRSAQVLLDALADPDQHERLRRSAERLAGRIATRASGAFDIANFAVINRIGDVRLMPPIRVMPFGETPDILHGNHALLVEMAMHAGEPVPEESLRHYGLVAPLIKGDRGDLDIKSVLDDGSESTETDVLTVKTRTKRQVSDPLGRIEDVGEKIGGARKDFYRKALSVSDIETLNELERQEFVKKAYIWPWSVKAALEKGVSPSVVQWIKTLRRNIHEFDPSLTTMEKYIGFIEAIRDGVGNPTNMAELTSNLQKFRLSLIESGDLQSYRHPMTGQTTGRLEAFGGRMQGVEFAIGRKGIGMVDVSHSFSFPERNHKVVPMGWASSRSESFERNPEYGRQQLMPKRTVQQPIEASDDAPKIPVRPHLSHLVHEGFSDTRQGQDITAEQLLTHFGFRAIEFGKWVPQDERQQVINFAWDGMHALCETLGIEPDMVSLKGELALAFGARGRGGKNAAMAHYERMRKVINLTRISGAGSLMHEWIHAFDHRMGEILTGKGGQMLSESKLQESAVLKQSGKAGCAVGKSLSDLLKKIRTQPALEEEVRAEMSKFSDLRKDWAASWIRDAVSRGVERQAAEQGGEIPSSATKNALSRQIIESAIREKMDLRSDCFGGKTNWVAFDCEAVAQRVCEILRSDYGIRLDKNSRNRMKANLVSFVSTEGALQAEKLTEEERSKRFPAVPGDAFRLPAKTTESLFLKNAKKLDETRSKDYWSTDCELLARAGEQYVFYRMRERGGRADYLVHGVEEGRFSGSEVVGDPYPGANERKIIGPAFGKWLESGTQLLRDCSLKAQTENKMGHKNSASVSL